MKKTLKATGVKDRTDYFSIVRNKPPHLQPRSESATTLRKKIEPLKSGKDN
ncbi:MAG: hypothetical protein KA713_13485 [Chryseotalea sp. WA131a]|nr:MAG: hypothetical protein KA713_13485 [Chryseotalea sp. WA131a]